MSKNSWNVTDKIQDGYIEACKKALGDEHFFKNGFRRDPRYCKILEHTSYEIGMAYLSHIVTDMGERWIQRYRNAFKIGDTIGNPVARKFLYFDFISPSTLKYVKVLSDLTKHFGRLDGWSIAEVGCGYGGQCKVIQDVYNIDDYILLDLPDPLRLTRKYLKHFGMLDKTSFNVHDRKNFDLCISNYAFSELTKTEQDHYFDHVIAQSTRGYITYNKTSGAYTINEIAERIAGSKIIPEKIPGSRSEILIWGPEV